MPIFITQTTIMFGFSAENRMRLEVVAITLYGISAWRSGHACPETNVRVRLLTCARGRSRLYLRSSQPVLDLLQPSALQGRSLEQFGPAQGVRQLGAAYLGQG